jgi:SET domain-containing protein
MKLNLSFRSAKTVIKNSPIHGKGLFAATSISKGEVVAVKGGYIFDREQLDKVEEKLGPAEIQIGENLFIGPKKQEERDGAMIYLNHSCEPNIGIQGQIVFVAIRDISSGEELTHDWATTDFDDYQLNCNCGAKRCRGIITGRDWQKKELQKKYKGYFAWYLQKKIDGIS